MSIAKVTVLYIKCKRLTTLCPVEIVFRLFQETITGNIYFRRNFTRVGKIFVTFFQSFYCRYFSNYLWWATVSIGVVLKLLQKYYSYSCTGIQLSVASVLLLCKYCFENGRSKNQLLLHTVSLTHLVFCEICLKLILSASTPQNGQTHLSPAVKELFECV